MPMIPNSYPSIAPSSKSLNQPKPKLRIKTPPSNSPKLPKKRNFNKIWKSMNLDKQPILTCLANPHPPKHILNAPNLISKNKINFWTNKICASFTKNPWKLFAFTIFKKFVPNVQSLVNTKATISRAWNKLKKRKDNFTND